MGLTIIQAEPHLRIVGDDGCWSVEKQARAAVLRLMPGRWHAVNVYKRMEPAMEHVRQMKRSVDAQ